MSEAHKTLFYPFEAGRLDAGSGNSSALFVNAKLCDGLGALPRAQLKVQQYFKPYADELAQNGYDVLQGWPDISVDDVLFLAPKNRIETQHCIARSAGVLKEGGRLICAAANDAGGNRLKKFLIEAGFDEVGEESKHKGRVVWGTKGSLNQDVIDQWLVAGGVHEVLDGQFVSVPGIYGWDKIDQGSELLLQHVPEDLSGHGADFGCGYGFLSAHVLQHNPDIEKLECLDADARALEMCAQNLEGFGDQVNYHWADLTANDVPEGKLDWIVMNPPFHEGKQTDYEIGQRFIQTACYALKEGGRLFMVANRQLPYEEVLRATFSNFEMLAEEQGFKVFAAQK